MTDVLPLPPQAEKKLYEYGALSRKAEEAGDIATAEKYVLACWDSIPDPKLAYDHAQSMTVSVVAFYRDIGQPGKAKEWLPLAHEAYGPQPDPYVEFLEATVHYEAGELDQAYALFDSLFKAYKTRPFQGEKPEYLAFYMDRATGKESPITQGSSLRADVARRTSDNEESMELPDDIYQQIESLSEAGNECSDEGDFKGAIENWRQALAVLPEPSLDWEAATWLYASLGDAYYQLADYGMAKDALFIALSCPDGQGNAFIHYMMGKTLMRLNDAGAVDELLRAYMLDGVDLFESDEDEGSESLKLLEEQGLLEE
ncbi:MAG TPA: hypothetical protein VIP51_15615 [Eoetvoesiella sp.]